MRHGPNYTAERARFTVGRGGEEIAQMFPEKRLYDVRAMPTTEAAIRTTFLADLYVVIGDGDGPGGWTVRVYHEPLVPWLWLGRSDARRVGNEWVRTFRSRGSPVH